LKKFLRGSQHWMKISLRLHMELQRVWRPDCPDTSCIFYFSYCSFDLSLGHDLVGHPNWFEHVYTLALRGGASLHFRRFSSWVICQCLFLCVGVIKPIRLYSVSHWASLVKSMPCLHNLYHVRLQLVLELTKILKCSLEVLWITDELSC
jgi:hypothetical protein